MTDFEIVCPSCGRKSRGKPEFAGRRATCPKCKSVFVVKFKEETPEAEPEEYAIADSPEFDQPAAFDPFASDPDDIPAPPAGFSAYASPKPAMAASDLPESRSYPALNFVRIALLIMAALVAACWLGMLVLLLIGMVAFVREYPGAPPEGLFDPASALPVQDPLAFARRISDLMAAQGKADLDA